MMRTFSADAETDDGAKITVEYHYERAEAVIDSAKRKGDEHPVTLTDSERERIETWIYEYRFFDDYGA